MLLVEDDERIRYAIQLLLEPFFEVQSARDGASAERCFTSEHFDVAFVDYRLPDMTGVELLRRLRAADPSVRRILTSGLFVPEICAWSTAGLVHGFVLKPMSLEDIVHVCEPSETPSCTL
jgi:two-component system, OmpR family, response regulator